MIREVNLASYLPPYLQEFKETVAALAAENPEFLLIWDAVDRVLYNHFISTADEYGISRYESMLGIYPSSSSNLESRRSRVQSKWANLMPYTMKALIQKLTAFCGEDSFVLSNNFSTGYTLNVVTSLENYGQIDDLWKILDGILPCNILVVSKNEIHCVVQSGAAFHCQPVGVAKFILTNDFNERFQVQSAAELGNGYSYTVKAAITTQDFKEIAGE